MRAFAVSVALGLGLLAAAPARAEGPAPAKAEPKPSAPVADKPSEDAEPPKESPLPFAMYMAGAGVGTAAVGADLAFATDDLGSHRLGVPLMIGGGLAAAAGVTLVVLSTKEPAKTGRAPRVRRSHSVMLGPTGAAYSLRF